MVDETTDVSSMEQLSICIRFVAEDGEVCEEFLGFQNLKKWMHNPYMMSSLWL